jgi:hypothetical protein
MKNIHNLSRTIPQRIKDQIRRESGYACVVCGVCPYDYEHIQPEFKDASSHDPEKMTLLCPLCHRKVTNKVFSKDLIWQAKKEPWAIKNGHTKYGLDFFGDEFKFVLGNFEIDSPHIPLVIGGVPILEINHSEIEKTIILNGRFFHGSEEVGRIVDNEWQGFVSDVDIQTVSNRVSLIRNGRNIFEFELFPPNKIIITEMAIKFDNNLAAVQTDSKGMKWFLLIGDARISGAVCFAEKERYTIRGVHSIELKGPARFIEKEGEKIEFIKLTE